MRSHIATVLGIAPPAPLPGPRRRANDRLAVPRVLVYLEGDRVEVILEPHDGVQLDAAGAEELASALLVAVAHYPAGAAHAPQLD